jgi:hypothetical protein
MKLILSVGMHEVSHGLLLHSPEERESIRTLPNTSEMDFFITAKVAISQKD